MKWSFVVPRTVPSRNENTRRHHWAVTADLSRWAADLRMIKIRLGIPDAVGPRAVTITRLLGKGQKFYDPRNLDDKTLVDAMKPPRKGRVRMIPGASLLVDDSMKWARITVEQERAADGKAATRIEIEDIEPEGVP